MLLICGFISAGLLSGCGTLPQPFRPADGSKSHNPFLIAPEAAGVTIMPIIGIDADRGQRIALQMATLLQRAGLPAAVGRSNPESHLLTAAATVRADAQTVEMRWFLDAPSGENRLQKTALWPAEIDPLTAPTNALNAQLNAIVAAVAAELKIPPARKPKDVSFTVSAVVGAPADGNTYLQQAMHIRLRRAGYRLQTDDFDVDYIILGHVTVSSSSPDGETIAISWSLMTAGGDPVGQIEQSNNVPAGTAAQSWRRMAGAITDAVLPAVIALIKKAESQNSSSKRQ